MNIGSSTSAISLAAMQGLEAGRTRRTDMAAAGASAQQQTNPPQTASGPAAGAAGVQFDSAGTGDAAQTTPESQRLAQAYGLGGARPGAHLSVMA